MSNMEEIEALKAEQAKLKTSRDGLELTRDKQRWYRMRERKELAATIFLLLAYDD